MGTTQQDWSQLAAKLGVNSEDEAKAKAFEIANYVADIENADGQSLLLKQGNKLQELTLKK